MRYPAKRNLAVAFMLLALAACSTDTPTAPEGIPAPPPGSAPSTAWNITVTANPGSLAASDDQPATITVRVRRASDGSAPANGTTAIVSAGLGEFISSGSGAQSVVVSLSGGAAQLLYFAGAILGTDTIQAQLGGSVGSAQVRILEPEVLFIERVNPTSGPERGGTRIRISGTGFTEPARVILGGIHATVDKVGKDAEGGFIRAFTGPVFNPDSFFGTETCDTDGDGSLDGARFLPKTVNVKVEFVSETAALSNAFTYTPADTSCRDITPDPDRPRARFSFTVNGATVLFNNESTPPGVTSNWIFGDGTTGSDANPIHTYPGSGSYDVTLRVSNTSGTDDVTKTVVIP